MAANDRALLRFVIRTLGAAGVPTAVFGGWAEELLLIAPPRRHRDIDLLGWAADLRALDAFLAGGSVEEIHGKRFPHKRAFLLKGVMVEVVLRDVDAGGPFTDIWDVRHGWSGSPAVVVDGLRVAAPEDVLAYRAAYARLPGPSRVSAA